MMYNQSQEITQYLTIGNHQFFVPSIKQQWIDDFLTSRRQGLSQRTLEFYRDTLNIAVGIKFTSEGINDWLHNLSCGNENLITTEQ